MSSYKEPDAVDLLEQTDIKLYRGDTFEMSVTWYEADEVTPVDLTGATARMQIRQRHSSPDPPAAEVTDADGITLGGAAGTIDVVLDPAKTALDGIRSPAVYDLELTESDGKVTTIAQGNVLIQDEVSR